MTHPFVLRLTLWVLACLAACSSQPAPADAGPPPPPPCAVGPAARDAAAPSDASVACAPNATEPARSYDFAVTAFAIDPNQRPSAVARPVFGFNFDNTRSPTTRPAEGAPHCAYGDFTSSLDLDQNGDTNGRPCTAGSAGCTGGVDNQLPAVVEALGQFLAPGDPARELNARIARGGYAMLIRVSDVNGPLGPTLCDPEVTVRVYRGVPLAQRCASLREPGQPYAIAATALCAAGDPTSVRFAFPGAIVGGRLRVFPRPMQDPAPSLEIPLPRLNLDFDLDLELHNPVLRANLGADGTLSGGNLGGILLKRDLLTALERIPALRLFLAAAAPLIDGFVDIATPLGSPDAICTGIGSDRREQGGIGIGLGFTAIPAVITETVVAMPPDASCAP
jgi:hypothetical protein